MMFNSMQFAIFFPVAVLFYFVIPYRVRNLYLLALSYFYYMCWNPKYALLLLASTVITYASGLVIGMQSADENGRESADANGMQGTALRRKAAVAVSFILNIAILGFFKYFGFAVTSIQYAAQKLGVSVSVPAFDVLLPVGISFYIFQALSYTMDVYRGEIGPEKDFFKYALFVSFFPQLVAGPIERSKNLLRQFDERHDFDYDRVREGLTRMLWGFFMKLVLAQRLAIIADLIYESAGERTGYQLCLGTFAFAFQIYCDFASYSEIAIGAAEVMGFELMENFRQPFFARSCKELWNRWHISLNTWFRDYLYFPLGGSRKGKIRKHVNLMIVFLVSGLWHGAAWTYVIWGGLSGLFQVLGEVLAPVRRKLGGLLKYNRDSVFGIIFSTVCTFLLFCFSLVFFRSESVGQAMMIMGKIFTGLGFLSILTTSPFSLGLGAYHLMILVLAMVILFAVDLCREKGIGAARLGQCAWYVRWSVYFVFVGLILLSANFGAEEFIYFQF